MNAKTYADHRKKLLKEEMKLVCDRDKLNKSIRAMQKELRAWDNYLLQG